MGKEFNLAETIYKVKDWTKHYEVIDTQLDKPFFNWFKIFEKEESFLQKYRAKLSAQKFLRDLPVIKSRLWEQGT